MFPTNALHADSLPALSDGLSALELYDGAASIVPMGAFECDLASERLTWTNGVFEMFGLPAERPAERRATVEMYCEQSREVLEHKRSRAIETGTGFSLDARIHRPDGLERWIRITAAVRKSHGRARTLYGMKQDITEDRARWESLRAQAECDPLTGVANRARFQRFLEGEAGDVLREEIGALVVFDLDNFKQINDRWGHAAGDRCLVAFGRRLQKAFPAPCLVSRLGGDEFAVLLPPLRSRTATERALRAMIPGLLNPVPWDGDMVPLTASVGLAFASPLAGLSPERLYVAADRALYDAKKNPASVLVCI
ncbi:sensor domain-containing diguanylate cyclase [Pelagibacterium montanilacus]|uniref:sensor domain-containing diguanylate cyclase n=1 Tax=Pelagibacterium montanilacus TaxID=2185280 RepID=UPI001FE52EF8|nr:diguanylate cyclase [Pelagibacterium montanilacus]